MNWKELVDSEMNKTKDVILNYPWEDKKAYAIWLTQTFNMVNHSTRLVALAGAMVPVGREELHARFVDHSKEERGHQKVCLNDINKLGYKIEDLPVTAEALCMYQIQYYWIQHVNPVSFFGYTFSLECLADKFGPEVAQRVIKAHGSQASRFLVLHAEDDKEHVAEAYEAIKHLKESDQQQVVENFRLSCELYRTMLIKAQNFALETGKSGLSFRSAG